MSGPISTRSRLDQAIGSLLERWLNEDTGELCTFCREERVRLKPPDVSEPAGDWDGEKFCSRTCADRFGKVFEARLEIGKRDLDQRGYD